MLVKGTSKGDILYNLETKERKMLPNFDDKIPAERINYLVPGRDAVLTQSNQLNSKRDDYVGISMALRGLDGHILSDVDLKKGENALNQYPLNIVCSQHMIAFTIGNGTNKYIRIYAIQETDSQ